MTWYVCKFRKKIDTDYYGTKVEDMLIVLINFQGRGSVLQPGVPAAAHNARGVAGQVHGETAY